MSAILTSTIDTPHPVYGLQWSADGERLALCGGFLYGGGFVGLADRSGQLLTLRDQASLTDEPLLDDAHVILSAVCIDESGRWLLAAASSYKWHARGPLLFVSSHQKSPLPGPISHHLSPSRAPHFLTTFPP